MKRLEQLGDESGTTLVELMVGLMAGLIVLSALAMLIITTVHGSARVTARVEATQRARIAIVRLMEELHSSCVTPELAPIQKESSGDSLRFVHQTGSEVQPVPVYSVVTYSEGKLVQQDYEVTGTAPKWKPAAPIGSPRTLLTAVSPIAPSSSLFSYYRYSGGTISETPQPTPLSEVEAELTVEVHAALSAEPETTPVQDAGSAADVQDSATLRLTPPSFNEGSPSKPCQ